MKAKARFLGHPVHQMLIPFPLGLLGTSVIFDVIYLLNGSQSTALVAYWMLASGIVGAMLAIPFGLIDYTAIPPNTRAKKIGFMHGIGNVILTIFFIASFLLRNPDTAPSYAALAFSFSSFAMAGVTAWLGGELVSKLGIGVHEHASPNAKSSLDDKHR